MFTLYKEVQIEQTKSQKERNTPLVYTITKVRTVDTKDEADEWVNKDSGLRSWSENELGAS